MKLINPKVEIIPQEPGLLGVYKQIEIAGRTCYKSEDKITEDSCKEFVQRMIDSGHTAMLEHGTLYLRVPADIKKVDFGAIWELANNKFTKTNYEKTSEYNYIATNLRVLVESDWIKALKYICEPTEFHEKRITVRFICDRGVSHELVRHRVFSFAQESTRYCNYSNDKFGNELTFIIPSWEDTDERSANSLLALAYGGGQLSEEEAKIIPLYNGLQYSEMIYFKLLNSGFKPQQARQVLPNALKTEVVMTGFVDDWKQFFELRCAPNAHPDMQVLAKDLYKQFEERKLI